MNNPAPVAWIWKEDGQIIEKFPKLSLRQANVTLSKSTQALLGKLDLDR